MVYRFIYFYLFIYFNRDNAHWSTCHFSNPCKWARVSHGLIFICSPWAGFYKVVIKNIHTKLSIQNSRKTKQKQNENKTRTPRVKKMEGKKLHWNMGRHASHKLGRWLPMITDLIFFKPSLKVVFEGQIIIMDFIIAAICYCLSAVVLLCSVSDSFNNYNKHLIVCSHVETQRRSLPFISNVNQPTIHFQCKPAYHSFPM